MDQEGAGGRVWANNAVTQTHTLHTQGARFWHHRGDYNMRASLGRSFSEARKHRVEWDCFHISSTTRRGLWPLKGAV